LGPFRRKIKISLVGGLSTRVSPVARLDEEEALSIFGQTSSYFAAVLYRYKSVGKIFKSLIFSLNLLLSAQAFAEGGGAQFGMVGGYSVPDADNTNPHQLYGFKGSANVTGGIGLGGYYLLTGSAEGVSGGNTRWDYSLHGVELNFALGATSGTTYMAVRVGLSKVNTTQSGVDLLFSPYHYGFVIGHDYNFWGPCYVGFEGSYLRIENSSTTAGGTSYIIDKSNVMNFLIALTFRF
jgi:hypothetical protein